MIARAEALGFAPTGGHYPPRYRDNDRLVLDDEALAAALWPRLRALVPAPGGAVPTGLNGRFRLCRYRDGQSFCVHRDGPHVPTATRRSLLTCQVYLNDAAEMAGGRTRFFASAQGGEPTAQVWPSAGSAIVFDHRLWHDGEPVTAGTKWVLRSDVMFDCPEPGDGGARHRGYVWAACLLPDGALVTAGRDGEVRAFDVDGEALRPRWARRAHEGSALSVAAGPGGVIHSAGRDHRVRRALGAGFETIFEGSSAALSLVGLRDGVAASFADGTVVALGPGPARSFGVHGGWAWSLCEAPDGRVASVGEDGTAALLDPLSGAIERLSLGVALRVVARAGEHLYAGDERGWIHQLAPSPRGLAALRSWRAHGGPVTCLAALGDGLVSGSEDQRVVAHDGRLRPVAELRLDDFVRAVVPLPSGHVAVGAYDGAVRVAPPGAFARLPA